MQRKFLFALLAAGMMGTTGAFAQTRSRAAVADETIVLKPDGERTVIELKNGKVYINGEKVATVDAAELPNVHKKIIIEHGDADGDDHSSRGYRREWSYGDNGDDRDETRSGRGRNTDAPDDDHNGHRALLGVMTDRYSRQDGAVVTGVTPGSPADKAGLQAGDVIMELDGKEIANGAALTGEVAGSHKPGDEVSIRYERDGKTRSTTALLAEAPAGSRQSTWSFNDHYDSGADAQDHRFHGFRYEGPGRREMRGMEDDRPKIGVAIADRENGRGVKVLRVSPDSPAEQGGLKAGDVILRVDGEQIGSAEELQDVIGSKRPGGHVTLGYRRDGESFTTDVKLPSSKDDDRDM